MSWPTEHDNKNKHLILILWIEVIFFSVYLVVFFFLNKKDRIYTDKFLRNAKVTIEWRNVRDCRTFPVQNFNEHIHVYSFGVDLRIYSHTRLCRIFWFVKLYAYYLQGMTLEMSSLRLLGIILILTWFVTFCPVECGFSSSVCLAKARAASLHCGPWPCYWFS
jgi:hypothetical protein